MTEETFGELVQLNDELGLDIPQDHFDEMIYIVYLGDEETVFEDVGVDDIVGYTEYPYFERGDCFSNPWDANNHLRVIKVDPELGKMIVELRRN